MFGKWKEIWDFAFDLSRRIDRLGNRVDDLEKKPAMEILSLQPNDVLVFRMEKRFRPEGAERFLDNTRKFLERIGHDPANTLILEDGMKISVIRR